MDFGALLLAGILLGQPAGATGAKPDSLPPGTLSLPRMSEKPGRETPPKTAETKPDPADPAPMSAPGALTAKPDQTTTRPPLTAPPAATTAPPGLFSPPTQPPTPPAESEWPAKPASPAKTVVPGDLVVEGLTVRPGSGIAGQPLKLSAALGNVSDRRQQLDIVFAYWRVAELVIAYNACWDLHQQLRQLTVRNEDSPLLRTAVLALSAELQETQATLVTAQNDLLAIAGLPPGTALPLPADRPHTGEYRTNFKELSARGYTTPRSRVLDQTLPLLRTALDLRASATVSAQDATAIATDGYRERRNDLAMLLACAAESCRQRRAFASSVVQYNQRIAEYAMGLTLNIGGPTLVGMLIAPAEKEKTDAVKPTPDSAPSGERSNPPSAPPTGPTGAPPTDLGPLRATDPRLTPTPKEKETTAPPSGAPAGLAPVPSKPLVPSATPESKSEPPGTSTVPGGTAVPPSGHRSDASDGLIPADLSRQRFGTAHGGLPLSTRRNPVSFDPAVAPATAIMPEGPAQTPAPVPAAEKTNRAP